jgi:hypothetical protein
MKTIPLFFKGFEKSKALFYISLAIVTVCGSFGYGLYSFMVRNLPYKFAKSIYVDVLTTFAEGEEHFTKHPKQFLFPARYDKSGVTVNNGDDHGELILIAGFFNGNHEIRLIRRNGEIVNRWIVKFSEIFRYKSRLSKPATTDWDTDIDGAMALPDGSVVFNLENGGFVKLDRCGHVLWTLPTTSHHSVIRAEGGGFWVPGRHYHKAGEVSPFPPFPTPFAEDVIMRISDEGSLMYEISVPKLFYDNHLEALLTATGENITGNLVWDEEIVHLNKIAELKDNIAGDFPMFHAGDLLLSERQYNLLFVVDPHTWIIKWWKIGPWVRQHDPEFIPGGKIIVLNNNCYRKAYDDYASVIEIPRVSNIIEYNFLTDKARVVYGGKSDQEFLNVIRGTNEFIPGVGLFITEFEGGRAFETDKEGRLVWEYVNRYGQGEVAEITEGHVYGPEYFAVTNWSCAENSKGK